MKKWQQSLGILSIACVSFCANASALEFIEVGNKSLGMGGAGVAFKNNSQSLFFNPALIANNSYFEVGYSAGGTFNEKNMLKVVSSELNNIQDVQNFNTLLKDNELRARLQGALSLRIGGLGYGTAGIGVVMNAYGTAGFSGYLPTNRNNVNGAGINFNFASVRLTEVPLAYGVELDGPIGTLGLGVSVKYLSASFQKSVTPLDTNFDVNSTIERIKFGSGESRSNFGVDLGLTYSPISDLYIGLVAKNLNSPTFAFSDYDLKIRPQVRAGASFSVLDSITIAADADLTNNDVISLGNGIIHSQKIGVGASFDVAFFDLRVGIAKDLRQDNGAIVSLGLGGFGILDVALAVSTQTSPYTNGNQIPRYVAIQIGGGFSF
ncbi:conjugal transfer protein TraF [Helicobacter sp. 23-1048]